MGDRVEQFVAHLKDSKGASPLLAALAFRLSRLALFRIFVSRIETHLTLLVARR
jgi:hypothetical protein